MPNVNPKDIETKDFAQHNLSKEKLNIKQESNTNKTKYENERDSQTKNLTTVTLSTNWKPITTKIL